ncbi:unnamed protein product, partial [Rotaria sp. Silwood1]
VPKGDMIILMRDFNAHVGKQEHLTIPQMHISTLSIPTTERDRQNKPLTLEDLHQALRRMKSRKGRDNDDISADKFKVDIQKAYDSVKKELLWKICQHYGLTKKNRSFT